MAPECASLNCTLPGTLVCCGCRLTFYCSKACQKAHWKSHKPNCISARKSNSFIIRAAPASEAKPVLNNIPAQIEPLHLEHYGIEQSEKSELMKKLKWGKVGEVGKFYDHAGSDNWYYYVYGDVSPNPASKEKASSRRPMNEIGNLICYKKVYGDIVVVRSGPADAVFPSCFTHDELCKAVAFYKKEDRSNIFAAREKSRYMRKMGMEGLNIPHFHFNI